MASLLIRGGTILTMNDRFDTVQGDVLIRDGRIEAVGLVDAARHDTILDASGALVLPGSSRRTSTCARRSSGASRTTSPSSTGCARASGPWRRPTRRPRSGASTRLAACELLSGGTTSVLTMETVHDTEAVFEEVAASGLRAVVGKCLMDADAAVPAACFSRPARRLTRAWTCITGGTARQGPHQGGVRAAIRRVLLARPARGSRNAVGQPRCARAHSRLRTAG